jgi:hypothetical protein
MPHSTTPGQGLLHAVAVLDALQCNQNLDRYDREAAYIAKKLLTEFLQWLSANHPDTYRDAFAEPQWELFEELKARR